MPYRPLKEWAPTVITWLGQNMSCKTFARHVANGEQVLEGGVYKRFHFWLHWLVCPFCRRYWAEVKELGTLHKAQSTLAKHPAVKIPEVKARIREKLMRR